MVVVDGSTGNGFGIKALDANPAARTIPSEIPVIAARTPSRRCPDHPAREVKPREL